MDQADTRERDPLIFHGICNPKGEERPDTTFLTQDQLLQLAPTLKKAPVKILHLHKDEKQELLPASGEVIHSLVHPETGELHAFFTLYDTQPGKVAQYLTGELPGLPQEKIMNSLSLGSSVEFIDGEPTRNRVNELTLCWEPDRKGSHIIGKIPTSKIKEIAQQRRKRRREEEESKPITPNPSPPPPPVKKIIKVSLKQPY
jgi:hypothetical protein